MPAKRETGDNPVRYRRCKRGVLSRSGDRLDATGRNAGKVGQAHRSVSQKTCINARVTHPRLWMVFGAKRKIRESGLKTVFLFDAGEITPGKKGEV